MSYTFAARTSIVSLHGRRQRSQAAGSGPLGKEGAGSVTSRTRQADMPMEHTDQIGRLSKAARWSSAGALVATGSRGASGRGDTARCSSTRGGPRNQRRQQGERVSAGCRTHPKPATCRGRHHHMVSLRVLMTREVSEMASLVRVWIGILCMSTARCAIRRFDSCPMLSSRILCQG